MPPRQNNDLRQAVDTLALGLEELRAQQVELRNAQREFFARIEPLLQGAHDERDARHGIPNRDRTHERRQPRHPHNDDDDEDTLSMDNPFAALGNRDAHRGGDGHRWESGFRLDLPEFAGDGDDDAAIDWLHSVEELLEFKGVPPDRRVPLVATRLRGRASAWWIHTKRDRSRHNKPPIIAWDKFRKYFEREFLPHNYSRLVYQRLQNLRQGTRSVASYSNEFYQLLSRNDLRETPEQLVSRYIGGLGIQFQDSLNLFNPRTISEAHQHATTLEKQLHRKVPRPWERSAMLRPLTLVLVIAHRVLASLPSQHVHQHLVVSLVVTIYIVWLIVRNVNQDVYVSPTTPREVQSICLLYLMQILMLCCMRHIYMEMWVCYCEGESGDEAVADSRTIRFKGGENDGDEAA